MKVLFFKDQLEFRKWLELNHDKEKSLLVGYYKVKTGKQSVTWSQSVDEALCYGWIDGIRRSIDDESYCIRFTPRNPKSRWSQVNIRKAGDLISNGLMQEAGYKLFINRVEEEPVLYSYEDNEKALPDKFEKMFIEDTVAWAFFSKQPPSYRKMVCAWILSGKQEKTREDRVLKLISVSRNGKRLFV